MGSAGLAWLARSASSAPSKSPQATPAAADERAEDRAPKILCRRCGEALSDRSAVFAMNAPGTPQTFVNPGGFLHEVLTVRWAENLVAPGPATTEFTWFPGYAWQIAWCERCGEHLGWRFTAVAEAEPRLFWGLRRDAIVEERE